MINGIYCIENIINGKKYIGQALDLCNRKSVHFANLKNNRHDNFHLQSAFNKYGRENFIFRILIYCEIFELTRYEQYLVSSYAPEVLYNIRLECIDSNIGLRHTSETKKKMSLVQKGKFVSKETGKRISYSKIGKKTKKSGEYAGVFFRKGENRIKRWSACFSNPDTNKGQSLGYFESKIEAAMAWNEAMIEFYGWKINGRLNKISSQEINELWMI